MPSLAWAGPERKSLVATEAQSARVQALREKRSAWRTTVDPSRLVFFDEAGSTISMARMFGRAPRGERVTDHVPRKGGTVTTMVGALTLRGGLEAMMTGEGGTDGNVFATFVEEVLAPTLKPGDLVVLDNAGARCDPRIPTRVARHGARSVFLPPYAPDLNPMELAWSTLKGFLRGAGARTVEVLNNWIAWGMELVTPEMASPLYKHCGYGGPAT